MNKSNKEIDKNRMSNLILLGSISMGIVRDTGSQSNIIPKGMLCIELRYFCKLNKEMNMVDSYCLFHSHNSHWGTDLYTLSELNPRNPIRMTNTMSDLCTVCMEIYMANKVLKNYSNSMYQGRQPHTNTLTDTCQSHSLDICQH